MRQRMLAVRMLTAAIGIVRLANITIIMVIPHTSIQTVFVHMTLMIGQERTAEAALAAARQELP